MPATTSRSGKREKPYTTNTHTNTNPNTVQLPHLFCDTPPEEQKDNDHQHTLTAAVRYGYGTNDIQWTTMHSIQFFYSFGFQNPGEEKGRGRFWTLAFIFFGGS